MSAATRPRHLIAMVKIVVVAIIATMAVALAIVLIRFNRKRLHILRCAQRATPRQLQKIYAEVERLGSEAPSCAVLAWTNDRSPSETDWTVPVPPYIEPWAGHVICADAGPGVSFRLAPSSSSDAVLRGRVYRTLTVPRHQTKSGKTRNQFSPARYVAGNPDLLAALAEVCPAYPAELLAHLLMPGAETFEFDPMFQARIGGSPSWVQDAEFPTCGECKKRMNLILQLPGTLLPGKKLPRGTFFFFGCARHPTNTTTIAQFT